MSRGPQITRRTALKAGGLTFFAAASGAVPSFFRAAAAASTGAGRPKVIVALFQRFGMDGVLAVTPYADTKLAALRPDLMLSPPGSGRPDARIDLDGRFGLHPALAPLWPLYEQRQLAIVHAAGSPHPTRSHSEAQQWWESGAPGDRRVRSGWLNRAVESAASADRSTLGAVALASERPRILYGPAEVATVTDLDELTQLGSDAATLAEVEALYRQASETLRDPVERGLRLSKLLAETRAVRRSAPELGYPEGSTLGQSLCEIAHLIRLDVGLRVAFAESRTSPDGKGTWDTHANAAALDGPFPKMARDLATSLAAFWKQLGPHRDDVTLVTLTDFGRNVVQNEQVGADHGRATAIFVLGGSVRGGKVYGDVPDGIERDALEDQMDLPVTTDYRSVLSPLLTTQLGVQDRAVVFPGWTGDDTPVVRA